MMIQKMRCKRKSKQRQNEELSAELAEKLFNGAHRRAKALTEIQFFFFLILIFCIVLRFCITKKESHKV
jgi:hypothetical protein